MTTQVLLFNMGELYYYNEASMLIRSKAVLPAFPAGAITYRPPAVLNQNMVPSPSQSGQDDHQYIVAMCLTKGELLALKNALSAWGTPVGMDVDEHLTRAARAIGESI